MPTIPAKNIDLTQLIGAPYLFAFAAKHQLNNLEDLLAFPLSALWKMEGFSTHAQNEIIDLLKEHGLERELKEY